MGVPNSSIARCFISLFRGQSYDKRWFGGTPVCWQMLGNGSQDVYVPLNPQGKSLRSLLPQVPGKKNVTHPCLRWTFLSMKILSLKARDTRNGYLNNQRSYSNYQVPQGSHMPRQQQLQRCDAQKEWLWPVFSPIPQTMVILGAVPFLNWGRDYLGVSWNRGPPNHPY